MMRIARWTVGATTVLLGLGLIQASAVARELGVTSGSTAWMTLFALWSGLLIAAAAGWALTLGPSGNRLLDRLAGRWARLDPPAPIALGAAGGCALIPVLLVLAPLPEPLAGLMMGFWLRAVVFWMAVLAGTALVSKAAPRVETGRLMIAVGVVFGCVYRAAAFLPEVSTDPFSLGWSEGSRYYYASLFLSEAVYGISVPPSVLHPTRYLMQAVPFLVDGLPLWFHRLWQVLLWVASNAAAAWFLARRTEIPGRAGRLLVAAWAFLFLFQGPVWYHLAVIPAFLFWAVRPADFRRTLLAVVAASLWAGVSRVNWIPFPAALAAVIYFLEIPQTGKSLARYLAPVFGWGVAGAAAGFGAQTAYVLLSGNPADQFGSSFTSDLLWYRLFPSATFPLGVLPGILLVTAPAVAAVLWVVRAARPSISSLQWLGIGAILAVFFGGGLVVSVKIGGGSNLHNLDAYIVLLLALAVGLVFRSPGVRVKVPLSLAVPAVLVPIGFTLAAAGPFQPVDLRALEAELSDLAGLVEAERGPVLFIAERQLLTFGEIDGAALVAEYEKVFLMEMAMAQNEAYLESFREDLRSHRFGLIVSDIVRYNPQTSLNQFGEENNAWDAHVSIPILCSYEEIQTYPVSRVQVLAPVEKEGECELLESRP